MAGGASALRRFLKQGVFQRNHSLRFDPESSQRGQWTSSAIPIAS